MKPTIKLVSLNHLAVAAAAICALALVQPAQATPLTSTGVSCSGQGTTMTSDPGYVACSGAWSGNNLNQSAGVSSQIQSDFGITVGSPMDVTGSDGNATSGSIMLPSAETGLFVISLKAGDAFSLYEFNGADVTGGISSINFDTLGVGFFSNGGKEHFGQGISHIDFYMGPSASVPEPATLALFAAGLAGLGVALRRRRLKA